MSAIGKTATFQVRPDAVEAATRAIEAFVGEVGTNEQGTLFYASFQDAADATRFLNVFAFTDAAAEETHRSTPWVKTFTDVLYPLTVDGVAFVDYRLVAATE